MPTQFHILIYPKHRNRGECEKSVHCEMKHFIIALTRIHTDFSGKNLKRLFGRQGRRWVNIKINVKEVVCENANRIHLPQYKA
jgi:hypothetical protein